MNSVTAAQNASTPWPNKALIFTNTREQCDRLFAELKKKGYPCALYRGEMDKVERLFRQYQTNSMRFLQRVQELLLEGIEHLTIIAHKVAELSAGNR